MTNLLKIPQNGGHLENGPWSWYLSRKSNNKYTHFYGGIHTFYSMLRFAWTSWSNMASLLEGGTSCRSGDAALSHLAGRLDPPWLLRLLQHTRIYTSELQTAPSCPNNTRAWMRRAGRRQEHGGPHRNWTWLKSGGREEDAGVSLRGFILARRFMRKMRRLLKYQQILLHWTV